MFEARQLELSCSINWLHLPAYLSAFLYVRTYLSGVVILRLRTEGARLRFALAEANLYKGESYLGGCILIAESVLLSFWVAMMTNKKAKTETPSKDRPFQPYRAPLTDAAKAIVADVINQIQNYEQFLKLRKRRRKKVDQATFEDTISAIVCDLIHRYCQDPSGRVSVSLSNRTLGRKSRYRAPALGKTLPTLLGHLSAPEMAFVKMTKGSRREVIGEDDVFRYEGQLTTIQAGPRLTQRIEEHDLAFEDLTRSETEEIIVLKAKKRHRKDNGKWIEYEDTSDTLRYRKDLQSINRGLALSDLVFYDYSDPPIDQNARRLVRIFNNDSFSQGGRLWGGFWANLKKDVRRNDILIVGEPIVELDYGQMTLRLLYGKVGAPMPEGDLYDIRSLGSREGVKKIIIAALSVNKRQFRMPQGARKYFSDDITYEHVLTTISEHHAAVSDYFFKGIGMELMFMETEILIDVLLKVQAQGMVALPFHDGVLTSQSTAQAVKEIMEEVFKKKIGVDAVVREESGCRPVSNLRRIDK